jgi:hypothetical protein
MSQVKSKDRVRDHGEVLTNEREVYAMLGLVGYETERIESRFLEPACGTGNFLLPVLEQKLSIVQKRYGKSQVEFERQSIVAVGSIYGIELLPDNAETCRQRLFDLFDALYTTQYKKRAKDQLRDSVKFVLDKNILVGDALSLKRADVDEPIVFTQWSLVQGSKVKRHEYSFEEMIPVDTAGGQMLFDPAFVSDTNETAFIPKSIKEHPLTHVLHLAYESNN